MSQFTEFGRRLRLGVVGGGPSSFIGEIHRAAARLDDRYEVCAAVLSHDPERSRAAAAAIGVAPERAYPDWRALLDGEAARPDGIDVLAIMTPNDSHCDIALAALDRGLDVICDKPLCVSVDEARRLVRKVRDSGLAFCLTHNYTGYPMVRQARAMVRAGELGAVRFVKVEYVQGWLAEPVEARPEGTASWRFDPRRAGPSLVLADIGTHAHHLACYVSGLEVVAISAEVGALVPGRNVHDFASARLRFDNGARGTMMVTTAAAGAEHGLMIRLFAEKGTLEWHQEHPNHLLVSPLVGGHRILSRGMEGLSPLAERATRVAIGHPEGFHEAFANLYRDAADVIVARRLGREPDPLALAFPTVLDGARGIRLIEAALESNAAEGRWVDCRFME
ncbi:MAG: Gfo/Idh/MocA family oxidoreductase [Rhodospirillaceae bacterium]|nr:Gfo/Idh/MocA family oxidoreductase [Rhodospirillaceae bacterium]